MSSAWSSLDLPGRAAIVWMALAVVTFGVLRFVNAPYGRHARKGWGPLLPNRVAWFLMEAPSPLLFATLFALGSGRSATHWLFLAVWLAHYAHRALIYPLRLRVGHAMPISVIGMGVAFNVVNAGLNGWQLFILGARYSSDWLRTPQLIAGVALFALGYVINKSSDRTLRALRGPGKPDYSIPTGGLFRWVSCPNYLGEIVEWVGWAIATWSLVGLSFAVWTVANLAPRALANHRWYRKFFPNYPKSRRALLPRIW